MKKLLLVFFLLLTIRATNAETSFPTNTCPLRKIQAQRLPDLNIPRSGHSFYCVNGQPIVIGGHTSGFVITPTIEYFNDGQWHVVSTVYSHDSGGSILLKSGKILLFGSHEKNLGIGQTYEVEMYDPSSHTSEGFGCLEKKRVMPSAVETDSGEVIIAGNWYHNDCIEKYCGESQFSFVKDVAVERAHPYMLPVSGGDVLIFGRQDTHGNTITSPLVDRLHGDAFSVPLFEQWSPLCFDTTSPRAEDCQIAPNNYLVPVADRASNQVAIALVCDTVFSLLPTETPIPMETTWGSVIYYRTPIVTNQQKKRAYMAGFDDELHLCVLTVEYDKTPASLTLYYTDSIPHLGLNNQILLTPEGNLLIAGGTNGIDNNNFSPSNQVWLIPVGSDEEFLTASTESFSIWQALLIILISIAIILTLLLWWRQHRKQLGTINADFADEKDDELMLRFQELMEQKQPYLDSNFRVSDAAHMLGVNRSRLSACINAQTNDTFNQYINNYRVEYAKQLMTNQPDIKIATVCIESGFNNETSFFRAFKTHTGKTPREWMQNKEND